jgi:hypothetical protein
MRPSVRPYITDTKGERHCCCRVRGVNSRQVAINERERERERDGSRNELTRSFFSAAAAAGLTESKQKRNWYIFAFALLNIRRRVKAKTRLEFSTRSLLALPVLARERLFFTSFWPLLLSIRPGRDRRFALCYKRVDLELQTLLYNALKLNLLQPNLRYLNSIHLFSSLKK